MKITQVEAIPFASFLYVRVDTDEGVHGIGEASLAEGKLSLDSMPGITVAGAIEHGNGQ